VASLPLVLAAACSSEKPLVPPVAQGSEHVACAVDGESELADSCSVERDEEGGKLMLVVHHPGGSFRRFEVLTDGRGLAVADGADEAATQFKDGSLDVLVGTDHYVFPASVKKASPATGGANAQ
jgi:hypothetical protein